MDKKDIFIKVPTMLVGKFKGYKIDKYLYFYDRYKIKNIPVIPIEEMSTVPQECFLTKNDRIFMSISDYKEPNLNNLELNYQSCVFLPTIDNISSMNSNNKSFLHRIQNFGNYTKHIYIYDSYDNIPEVKEILYDEKEEIEKILKTAKNDLIMVRNNNFFQPYICVPYTHDKLHEQAGYLSKPEQLFDMNNINKNLYIPEYIVYRTLRHFILSRIEKILDSNYFGFKDLENEISCKISQLELIKIIQKHYGNDVVLKTISANTIKALHDLKNLKNEFIFDFVDFYKKTHIQSDEIEDLDYYVDKLKGIENNKILKF